MDQRTELRKATPHRPMPKQPKPPTTAPTKALPTDKMPKGIPYIIGNEAAERFSYYGMKAILVIFMTKYLMDSQGALAPMNDAEAKTWYHLFSMANYFFPILGALVADMFWGKYKTIVSLSVVYCLGHLALAMFETRFGLGLGLTLIAIGSGGIKPCVSANVGDQFTAKNSHLIGKVFSYFYFAINFGAFFSSLMTPVLLERFGASVAFGVPGILMFIATVIFWMGRHRFVAIPPVGPRQYLKEITSPVGRRAIANLGVLYFFVAVFWALFDQTGSSWVLQAEHMNKWIDLRFGPLQFDWLRFELLSSQLNAVNPILVLAFIPLFSSVIFPALNKIFPLTALRKITIGMFIAAASFGVSAYAEALLQAGGTVSISWQILAYALITIAEICISITALEFSYTQAPNSMKSFIMGFYLLSVSLGNLLTAGVNFFIQNPDGSTKLTGASYYWFFSALMLGTAVVFGLVGTRYKERQFLQAGGDLANTPATAN